VREFYAARGLPAEKFTLIANGIGPFQPVPRAARDELLAELQLPADARLVGAIGRLWPQKRVKDLIWAMDLLKSARDDAHLLIIGDGPQRQRLVRYRDQNQIADRVHFLGERGDVPRIVEHLDCLWLASEYEGQSNAIMEAMAAGVSVVATDIAGNRDLVVPGETGFLVPVGDRAAFTRHTHHLLDDAGLARRLGDAGRRRMLEEFSVERMIERHASLYRQLLAA
jgi:glycosyltransferase involved in cell wall biosynthesis